ncbi:MAG: hypothetical protein K8L97_23760 [Anaerolineae bacterium]|nr:hypothetical protein [Anaerolineae bacterium]
MSLQTEIVKVESKFGTTAYNSWMRQDSDNLLVMLPGWGYTCENPLLFYLRSAALQQGFDVLSVQYGFQTNHAELTPETMTFVQEDVKAATDPVLAHGYKQVCIAGKSLGTPLAVELGHNINNANVSLLLLTPMGGAVMVSETLQTLAVVGTADGLYSAEWVESFANHPTVSWRVFEGLNHSLGVKDDWRASLAILPEIISACETFLIS